MEQEQGTPMGASSSKARGPAGTRHAFHLGDSHPTDSAAAERHAEAPARRDDRGDGNGVHAAGDGDRETRRL
eukprot:3940972-Rhodomonas_salina.3